MRMSAGLSSPRWTTAARGHAWQRRSRFAASLHATARSSAPGTTSGMIGPSRRSRSGCAKSARNEKPRVSARLACFRHWVSLWQRERRNVVRLRHRNDFDHVQLGLIHLLGSSCLFRLRFVFVHALFDPLFTVVYPHRASFLTARRTTGLTLRDFKGPANDGRAQPLHSQ